MINFSICSDWAEINSVLRNMSVLKLMVESKRNLKISIFKNWSDRAEINFVLRNMGVLKIIVESKRDLW